MRRSSITPVFRTAALAVLALPGLVKAEPGAVDEPIRMAIHEWTGIQITTYIAGRTLEKMGYKVEFVTAGYLAAGPSVADGSLATTLEVWDNNMGEYIPALLDKGELENLGELGLSAEEGFAYPEHMTETCPGLPAWDAFVACAQAFATADTYPMGRFLDYPADWGDRGAQLLTGEGLQFVAIPGGSEGAMVAEIKASAETKSPLVTFFWKPHWVLSEVKMGWVEIPDPVRAKYSVFQPKIFKVVWPGLKTKWPDAYDMLSAMKIDNDIQESLMKQVDSEGMDALAAVDVWMAENSAVWQPWIDAARD
jgi:glycine betaine/proline transport system substrate-binding protein